MIRTIILITLLYKKTYHFSSAEDWNLQYLHKPNTVFGSECRKKDLYIVVLGVIDEIRV